MSGASYTCDECGRFTNKFTKNQLSRGYSRCMDCTGSYPYNCPTCSREFSSENALRQHSVVHKPRDVSCPVCGDQKFRNPRDAVAHVESGYCSGCRGQDRALRHIYEFTQQRAPQFLSNRLMIGNGDQDVPTNAYACNSCGRAFKKLSSLMQHQSSAHGDTDLRIGY
jgi:DNA-directed RNA polymerase subunit RPC12/RpoP